MIYNRNNQYILVALLSKKLDNASIKKSIMYSHPTCGYCDLMRDELQEQGHDFEEIDVSKFPEYWKEIENLSGGDRITPVLVKSDGTVEIGFRGIGCNYNT